MTCCIGMPATDMRRQHASDPADESPAIPSVPVVSSNPRSKWVTLADQAASSLTNFGGSALAAGLLTTTTFGAFAVATSVLVIVVGVARTWSGLVLMIVAPDKPEEAYQDLLAGALSTSLAVGVVGSTLAAASSTLLSGEIGRALLVLAVCIPIICIQDAYRFGSLSRGRPTEALWNDLAWFLGVLAGLMVLRRLDYASLTLALLAANATAILGVIVAVRSSAALPDRSSMTRWVRRHGTVSLRLTAEFGVAIASGLVPLILVTAWNADLAAAGSLRGAQVLMGPVAVVFAASTLYLQPKMVNLHRRGEAVVALARQQSMFNVVVALQWGAVAYLTPSFVGVRLFGASWEGMQGVIVPVALSFIGLAISTGPLTAFRSRGQLSAGLIAQVMIALIVISATMLGGVLVSDGLIRGFAAGSLLGAIGSWILFSRYRGRDLLAGDRVGRS